MPPRFQRKRNKRPIKPRRIIFVEGQTERQYFNALKQQSSDLAINVRFEKNPKDMVKEAKKIITGEWHKKNDEIWFVLDNEEPDKRTTPAYWQAIIQFIEDRANIAAKLCISNVCFEVWLLAHFRNTGLNGNARELARALCTALGYDYQKGGRLKVDDFVSLTSQAYANVNISALDINLPPRGHSHIPHLIKALKLLP